MRHNLKTRLGRLIARLDMYLVDHGAFRALYNNLHHLGGGMYRLSQPSPAQLRRYRRTLGVRTVIFREFSALPITYQANVTRRYVDRHRVCIDDLIASCLASTRFRHTFEPEVLTQGYYFWNARWQAPDGMTIVFERSDYEALHACERTGLVYKLVFHANEHLCAGWQPDQHVLWRPDELP